MNAEPPSGSLRLIHLIVGELVVPFCKRGRIAFGSVAAAAMPGTTSVLNAAMGTAAVVVVMAAASAFISISILTVRPPFTASMFSFPEKNALIFSCASFSDETVDFCMRLMVRPCSLIISRISSMDFV